MRVSPSPVRMVSTPPRSSASPWTRTASEPSWPLSRAATSERSTVTSSSVSRTRRVTVPSASSRETTSTSSSKRVAMSANAWVGFSLKSAATADAFLATNTPMPTRLITPMAKKPRITIPNQARGERPLPSRRMTSLYGSDILHSLWGPRTSRRRRAHGPSTCTQAPTGERRRRFRTLGNPVPRDRIRRRSGPRACPRAPWAARLARPGRWELPWRSARGKP